MIILPIHPESMLIILQEFSIKREINKIHIYLIMLLQVLLKKIRDLSPMLINLVLTLRVIMLQQVLLDICVNL